MNILVSGSLAYDRIMDFPGKFSDHILPDKIHMLNVCFMRNWLTKNKISTKHIKVIDEELTAGAYITTDQSDNQITAFNPGAMKFNSNFDFDSVACEKALAIVAPGNLGDMVNFSNTYKTF